MKKFISESWFKLAILILIIVAMYLHFGKQSTTEIQNPTASSTVQVISTTTAPSVKQISGSAKNTEKIENNAPYNIETVKSNTVVTAVAVQDKAVLPTPKEYISNVVQSLYGYQTSYNKFAELIDNMEKVYTPLYTLDFPYGSRYKTAIDDLRVLKVSSYRAMNNISSDVNNYRIWLDKFNKGTDLAQVNKVESMSKEAYAQYSKEMAQIVDSYKEISGRIDKNTEEASKYLDAKIKEQAQRSLNCTYIDLGYGISKMYCE